MPSLLSSSYPSQLGTVGTVPPSRTTLPEVMSEHGFTTGGFHSNPYLSRAYGFDRGFDEFDDGLPMAKNRLLTTVHRAINHFKRQPYTRAETLQKQGLSWVADASKGKRFLWLHFMDPHGPYQPPGEFQRVFRSDIVDRGRAKRLWRRTVDEPESITADERDLLIDLYDAEIRYTDEVIGRFVDELSDRDVLSDSLVVIAADHGDAFGSHGIYGHPRRLYEELVHVPLLVLIPDDKSATIDRPVENIDVAPTILDAVGGPVVETFEGTSLLSDSREPPEDSIDVAGEGGSELSATAISEAHGEDGEEGILRTAVRTVAGKLHVETEAGSGRVLDTELYDLASDPAEEVPIDDRETRDAFLDLYWKHRKHVDDGTERDGSANGDVDSVVEDRLRDLGYR